jgi:threonine/homoserine/homoserine lactone efflux protein
MGLGVLSDGLFALVAGAAGDVLRRSQRLQHLLRWLSGASFIGLGVSAGLASRK